MCSGRPRRPKSSHGSLAMVGTLPFKNNQFDIAYSTSMIEHFRDSENQRSFAAEVARVRNCITCRRRIVGFPLNLILLRRLSISSPNRYKSIS